ncbi:MAG: hypothetical protein HY043_24305 [Verrucomicrobia bacterium]|nr:hypothetical protein [Verrucomicrobiota bacterium]
MLTVNPVKTIATDKKSGKNLTLYSDNLVRSLEQNVLANHGDWDSFTQKWDSGIYESFELSPDVPSHDGLLTPA